MKLNQAQQGAVYIYAILFLIHTASTLYLHSTLVIPAWLTVFQVVVYVGILWAGYTVVRSLKNPKSKELP